MESAGLNGSPYDASSLHSLHYGQFFKPPRRKSRFAFGRTYYDEDEDDERTDANGDEKPVPGRNLAFTAFKGLVLDSVNMTTVKKKN